MAQKDLIIGVFSNYGYDEVKPWVKSSKECGFTGDVVLIGIDISDETAKAIKQDGVIVVRAKKNSDRMIHMERFFHIYNYLKEHQGEYQWVVSTDVRDVIFQDNPSDYFNFLPKSIVSSGEAIQIKHEHWNKNNIIKNFSEYFYDEVKDYVVQCVGVLAGQASYMQDLVFTIFQMSLNRPDWVADQAAYNVIIHRRPWKEITQFTRLMDGWTINAHVTNYEPDKNRFEPFLLEPRPTIKDGLVVNQHGDPFYIVHQYDRVYEWKKIVEEKYGVKIKSQYTPDNDMIVINTGV